MKIVKIRFSETLILSRNASLALFILVFIVMAAFCLLKESILPPYFFADSKTLSNYMSSSLTFSIGDSFSNTALLYKLFGISESTIQFQLFSYFIVYFSLFYVVNSVRKEVSFFYFLSFLFCLFISTVYLTVFSKDFFVLIIVSVLFFFRGNMKRAYMYWFFFAFLYAVLIRQYWALFLTQFLLYSLFEYLKVRRASFILTALGVLVLSFIIYYYLGYRVDFFRYQVNSARIALGHDPNTMIKPLFDGDGFLFGVINAFYVLLNFYMPLDLVFKFEFYYFFIFIFIFSIMYRLFFCALFSLDSNDPFNRLCLKIMLSFTVVQAFFEPDFGSYIRHLSPFFPILLYFNLVKVSVFKFKGFL